MQYLLREDVHAADVLSFIATCDGAMPIIMYSLLYSVCGTIDRQELYLVRYNFMIYFPSKRFLIHVGRYAIPLVKDWRLKFLLRCRVALWPLHMLEFCFLVFFNLLLCSVHVHNYFM